MHGTGVRRSGLPAKRDAAAPTSPATVLIVDDDPLVRAALDSLFRSVDFATRLYANPKEMLHDVAHGAGPDTLACVVTDVRMPGVGGFELQSALGPEMPVIFMTGHGDIPMSVRAMKAGAVDFLTKPFRDQDMLDAVNAALQRATAQRDTGRSTVQAQVLVETLSPREREVMAGVVRGLLNKQIAGELGIAEITVKMHRSNLMRKLGVRRVPELVRLADSLRGG